MTTYYSQVWWAPLAPVPFPADFVKKWAGKDVAIVGWEIDQVVKNSDGTETSVPINACYNHHYNSQLVGAGARFNKIWLNGPEDPRAAELMKGSHGVLNYDQPHYVAEHVDPLASSKTSNTFLSSANGGEYRKSLHGFSPGYAIVVNSPTELQISPMQIGKPHLRFRRITDTSLNT
jgi:hypothetical protein